MHTITVADFEENELLGTSDDELDEWNVFWGSPLIFQHILTKLPPKAKVLDVCSAWGRGTIPLGLYGHHLTLVDKNRQHLEMAAEYAKTLQISCECLAIDVDDLKLALPAESFDAVIILEGIAHFDKLKVPRLLESASTMVKPGGLLYCRCHLDPR